MAQTAKTRQRGGGKSLSDYLDLIRDNPAEFRTVSRTVNPMNFDVTAILKHLDLLAEAGLVRSQHLGRETRYSFTPEPLADVNAWVERIGAIWDMRLQRLKDFVENEESDAGKEGT